MQFKNHTLARPFTKIALALLVTTLAFQAPQAQAQQGGFQSNITGGVIGSFTAAPGLRRGVSGKDQASPDFQNALQAANAAAAALSQNSTNELAATDLCVADNFPDSPARQQLRDSLKALQSNIAGVSDQLKNAMSADGKVDKANLFAANKNTGDLKNSLRAAVAANDALAKTATTPQQEACVLQTYDALDKVITNFGQLVSALNKAK